MDALLTQRTLAQQIADQGGSYLMLVKANQVRLRDDLAQFFTLPAIPADGEQGDQVTTHRKGHGRLDSRSLTCTTGECAYLTWPAATLLLQRTCTRHTFCSGKTTQTVSYGITNLPLAEASAALLEQLWRGHWTIERGSHYVRDVTLGEDRHHMHTGHAPQVLAALRNGVRALWRRAGWTNSADAVRATAVSVGTALAFIGWSDDRLDVALPSMRLVPSSAQMCYNASTRRHKATGEGYGKQRKQREASGEPPQEPHKRHHAAQLSCGAP